MKTKILMILLSVMLVFGTVLTFVSCGGNTAPAECTEHKDENGDGICDTEGCGKAVENTPAPAGFTVNYEVTVTDAEGNALEGAVVVITSQYDPSEEVTTGANGKASLKLEFDEEPGFFKAYAVVKSVPEGYEIPDRVLIEDGVSLQVQQAVPANLKYRTRLTLTEGGLVTDEKND